MDFLNTVLLALLGVVVIAIGVWALRHCFSPEARLDRRRRRSNSRVISNAKRPMVRFSVRARKKQKKD
ncbi:MAG: hypothetical protein IH623_28585 [Verrucomicrobia bacterium]|nr:hypothetical protein [Verrucomicrobiota bacterium]